MGYECIRDNRLIIIKTSLGELEVELFGNTNPVTVTNFINNVKRRKYEGTKFYKVIKFKNIKVIHAGIFSKAEILQNKDDNVSKYGLIPLEIKFKNKREPIYSKEIDNPSEIINLKNLFQRGSIAMVKVDKFNSSSTEFFLLTEKLSELDGRFSIFGKIVKGFSILEKLEEKDMINEILITY